MQLCDLVTTKLRDDAWHHRCQRCGKEAVLPTERWFTPCGLPLAGPETVRLNVPGAARRATSFAAETARWAAAGRPRRSEDRIAAIFAICRGCPLYLGDDTAGTCRACGCGLKAGGGITNKIAMATTRCPVGKWEAESEAGVTEPSRPAA